ncbi:ACT domain-containing protein, partial [Lactobacillus delbrueckii]
IMQGAFTMMLLAKIPDNGNFNTVKSQLATLGDQIGVEIKVARQEIFDAMHRL